MTTNNYDRVLKSALACERCDGGERWYVNKSAWIRRRANRYGVDMDTACAVYALMSWNNSVENNDRVFEGWLRTGEVWMMRSVERRVRLVEAGRFDEAFEFENAAKIATFRDNLRWPKRFAGATIDRHMGDVHTGDRVASKNLLARVRLSGYRFLEEMVRDAARRAGMVPSAAQARIWVHYVVCEGHGSGKS